MRKKFSGLKKGNTVFALTYGNKCLIECTVVSNKPSIRRWLSDYDRYEDPVEMTEDGYTLSILTKDGKKLEKFYSDMCSEYDCLLFASDDIWIEVYANKEDAFNKCIKELEDEIEKNEEKVKKLTYLIDADKTYLDEIKQKYSNCLHHE